MNDYTIFDSVTNMYRLVMVGMRHIDNGRTYADILKNKNDKWLYTIKAEPNNPNDSNAIAVYAGRDYEVPRKVGYLKKEHAALLQKQHPIKNLVRILVGKATNFNTYYAVLHIPLENFEKAPLEGTITIPTGTIGTSTIATGVDKDIYNSIADNYFSQKEPKMANNTVNTVMDKNVVAARSAAYLEAGRIANNQAVKLVASKAPLMVKGYVETPFGKLVVANAAAMAAQKLRGNDARLAKLTEAMMTEAWQEVYQIVDFEKMINDMLSNESIKAALTKIEAAE